MPALTRHQLQVARIARLLGVEPAEVHGLDDVPVEDVRALHDQVSHALFGHAQEGFRTIAALTGRVPGPLAARLAEHFVPPMIAARVTEVLDVARARDLVGRLRLTYLADVAVVLDPVRAAPVVRTLAAPRVGEIARELYARDEHAVMAEFAAVVTLEALVATLGVATPHDLLAVVPLLEWNERLDQVVQQLPEEQVRAIVDELDAGGLAELAVALGPERLRAVVALLAEATLAEVGQVLLERGEDGTAAGLAAVTERRPEGGS